MPAILKTWPGFMNRSRVLQIFNTDWGQFYFTLGRGKPQQEVTELWYTHKGEIIGYFKVKEIIRNLGDNIPRLRSISGEVSEWQIKLMNWVAICDPPFVPAPERAFCEGFRGYRYFDFEKHLASPYAKVRL
jgi:hypothetical protein